MALTLALLTPGDDNAAGVARLHLAARAAYYGSAGDSSAAAQQHDYCRMWLWRLAAPDWRLTGAFSEGSLRGFSAVQIPPDLPGGAGPGSSPEPPLAALHLEALYVHPDHWGLGIGSLLYDAFERAWRRTVETDAVLEVWSLNHRARAFYTRRGWELDGRVRPAHAGTGYLGMVLTRPAPSRG